MDVDSTTQFTNPLKIDPLDSSSLYQTSVLTRRVQVPFQQLSSSPSEIAALLTQAVRGLVEGKCVKEGFVRRQSVTLVSHSVGMLHRGTNVQFTVTFTCDVCSPVRGQVLTCKVVSITKAGIRGEVQDADNPLTVHLIREVHPKKEWPWFQSIQLQDMVSVEVVGVRYEVDDRTIAVLGKLHASS